MPSKNHDLHGNVPDEASVALLLIDVINDLEFPGGDALLAPALKAAENIAALKRRAKQANLAVIYVNDNFGKWQSDFQKLLHHCLTDEVRGQRLVELLRPDADDYFVLKPKHSGFFSTTLDVLLQYLRVKTLLLTGLTTDICVLFTANDAYLRDYHLVIPADCVAAIDSTENQRILNFMQKILQADITPSTDLHLEELVQGNLR
ncbi:MAG: cysteine hydrolase [Acidobacteria bacterium]|nr:cysteine hydrolase [Acidobacteriota bacterium]